MNRTMNPRVSAIYEREQYALGSLYVATHRTSFGRLPDEIAAAIGEPLYVDAALSNEGE